MKFFQRDSIHGRNGFKEFQLGGSFFFSTFMRLVFEFRVYSFSFLYAFYFSLCVHSNFRGFRFDQEAYESAKVVRVFHSRINRAWERSRCIFMNGNVSARGVAPAILARAIFCFRYVLLFHPVSLCFSFEDRRVIGVAVLPRDIFGRFEPLSMRTDE